MSTRPELLAAALADRYRINRELGMGGMATVYLADDLKHDRKVALKVLKPELAAVLGAERFVVEIKTTASLQHPHILPLFDSGTAGGFLYYVMPYIEGETLRDKLTRETQLGIDEAVRIAREVADALDYAHRHGVIHRDIKPENILLHDGRPMVVDFGIALALSAAAGGRMTETGLSLGTPHYMSPEQATGQKDISARTDVYSLASVLYEMLAGEPPHMGGSAQQVIMKIIAEPVQPVTKLRRSVPANVAAAVSKALEKLPADRFESAKAFADALGDSSFTISSMQSQTGGFVAPTSRAFAGVAVAGVVLVGAALWGWLRPQPLPPVVRYQLAIPLELNIGTQFSAPTPSPDGSFIVYSVPDGAGALTWQLWMKRRDSYAATRIAGTNNAKSFAFSPTGEWIVFSEAAQLKKVRVTGGAPITLVTDKVGGDFGVAWLDDGTIVYVDVSKGQFMLAKVSADGGENTFVWRSDSLSGGAPEAIVGKRAVLFTACSGPDKCSQWALDLRTGKAHQVVPGARWGQYAPTGHLVYVQGGRLLAVAFDPDRLEIRGQAVSLADSISGGLFPTRLSRSGTLVIRLGGSVSAGDLLEMVWVDRGGRITPVDTAWRFHLTNTGASAGWALSADDSRLAIGLYTDVGDHIWAKQLPRGALWRVSYGDGAESRPRWSAKDRITFVTVEAAGGIRSRRADGTGADSVVLKGAVDEGGYSPDGSWLVVRSGSTGPGRGGRDIRGVRRGDTAQVALIATSFDEEAIAISPDSKWIAYQSDETGRTEVFVRSFPNIDAFKRQVSNGGGQAPLWSRDGHELFFLNAAHDMTAVRTTSGSSLSIGEPVKLFHVPDELLAADYTYYTPWDVARDGRFIMARRVLTTTDRPATTVVAENWLQELKAKMKR
jgi:serine/threonine-protein kinase